jgi:hypothetical protein
MKTEGNRNFIQWRKIPMRFFNDCTDGAKRDARMLSLRRAPTARPWTDALICGRIAHVVDFLARMKLRAAARRG